MSRYAIRNQINRRIIINSKISKAIVILIIFAVNNNCFGQDKFNPLHFIQFQIRSDKKIENLGTDPLVSYLKSGTNIRINILKDEISRAIDYDYSSEYIQKKLGILDDLNDSLTMVWDEKMKLAKNDSMREKIRKNREIQIKRLITNPRSELNNVIKFSITAFVILKNGKKYSLSVPNYYNVIQQGDSLVKSSITVRKFGIWSNGRHLDDIVDTEIDLFNEKLSDGDAIKIEIETTYNNIKRKYVKHIVIKEYGWKMEFPPSILFVKRLDEPESDSSNESNPSNFKPAPGGSMLLTYKPKVGLHNQLLTGWSFGINVSLLDFELENNLELGVGFIIYGLNRSIGGGYGWNLHASEKESYYFISLDFLRTFETFRAIF